MLKKIILLLLIILYASAGMNHFWHPAGYYSIIPPYLPKPYLINVVAGIAELIAAALLIVPSTRKLGCYLIIAMLIAFIPAHIYMIQKSGCMGGANMYSTLGCRATAYSTAIYFDMVGMETIKTD